MRTTLELPDELVRRIKLQALERNQKLKDTIAQLLEVGLASTPKKDSPAHAPRPVQLNKRGPITIDDIESAIAAGRD